MDDDQTVAVLAETIDQFFAEVDPYEFDSEDLALRVVPQMIFGSPRVWGRPLCGPPVYPVRARL
ncbi:hypothetical protein ACIPPN_30100, partial [Streptomyces diastaticus]|uniref:hypothetical protein n=1 Tax=Streptomyces diastaticus TaxID=1956 RepID=UPI0037F34880